MLSQGRVLVLLVCSLVMATACSQSQPEREAYDPEAATGMVNRELATAKSYMVSAANPLAVRAGTEILARGGSAVDAAIAVQNMLTLVEPQSSGIGGGAFMLYWDASQQRLYALDARETAPAHSDKELFLDADGEPEAWIDAIVGGRSVGTPGLVRGMEEAHARWGQRPWAELFTSTIETAEQGFEVSPRLARLVELEFNPGVRQLSTAANYFFPDGEALRAGSILRNPELAETMRALATDGADAFYQGALAERVVNAVQHAEVAPGQLSLQDLAQYEVRWREPVCGEYRQQQICSMGPPSSGGTTLLQMLAMLERFELAEFAVDDITPWHWFTQASRLAYADRDRYLADPDFVDVPVKAMLDDDYLRERSQLIGDMDMGQAAAGQFNEYMAGINLERPNTTHISIVDAEGNAVSMTSTIEMGFGSGVMVGGFLLNNQLTDFSLNPYTGDGLSANRVEPGKRPRSSMTPVITFDSDGQLKHVVGSPGGPRIINYVAKTLVGLIDFELNMQQAINLPNITNLNGETALEEELAPKSWVEQLEARQHPIRVRSLNSGLHGITIVPGQLQGGADPRREGVAEGS